MSYVAGTNETLFWKADASHFVNIKYYLFLIPIFIICFCALKSSPFIAIIGMVFSGIKIFERYWTIKQTDYFFSHERLRIVYGGFNRKTFDLTIKRIYSVELDEPFLYQIFGIGIIKIKSYEWDRDYIYLDGIKQPRKIREILSGVVRESGNIDTYKSLDLSNLDQWSQTKLLN